MRIPQTCAELNSFIRTKFRVVEVSCAFLEFPFYVSMQGQENRYITRVVPITLALAGEESDCCKELWETLTKFVSLESLQDGTELLFLRSEFVMMSDEAIVRGRVAFWNPQLQQNLQQARSMCPQGALPRRALCA